MKYSMALLAVFTWSVSVFAQNLRPVDDGSTVKFNIRNLGINVSGTFKGLKGSVVFNTGNVLTADFKISVDATTINTGIDKRDRDLRKENYFDVAKYPLISFHSSKITGGPGSSSYVMNGAITIKGITKNISFPFIAVMKEGGVLFSGEFDLNRRDFKVGGNSLILSDNLHVTFGINAKKN